MKKKFSKILGVGLTLALLFSLLLTAAPVSAISVAAVSLSENDISKDSIYTITFDITDALAEGAVDTGDEVVVTFPDGTDITNISDAIDTDVTIGCSSGIGVIASTAQNAASRTDGQELTITVPATMQGDGIGAGATVQLVIGTTNAIVNPDDIGNYTLTVATQKADETEIEAAVTSTPYEIEVPEIPVLPGIVQQFNATGILMTQDTGVDAIYDMVDTAGDNYTIVVGPGDYAPSDAAHLITITQSGLTLESSAGAEDTTIDATAVNYGILISPGADDVTVDGFTVNDAISTGIWIRADDVTVQNNVVTFDEYYGIGIDVGTPTTGVTVSDNEIGDWGTMFVHGTDTTLSGNTFGECVNLSGTVAGLTITDNIMTASAAEAIDFISGTFTDVLIEGNTISEAAFDAIVIRNVSVTNLQILNNEITDNEGVGIDIVTGVTIVDAIAIKFNTITGNDADNDGYGIRNDSATSADVVDASLNWWGTVVSDDIAAMINDSGSATTTYEPFLADTAEALFSASAVAVGEDSLDAKDDVGVRVSVTTGGTDAADVISVAKYAANPQAAISDAIAFFDVYVVGTLAHADTEVTLKFYAGDENSTLEVWSADTEGWAPLDDADYSVYGGYVYVDVLPDLLDGTAFAVVGGEAVADVLGTPVISTPTSGADDVDLTPIFAWEAVEDADGYYFEFADNANFVLPLAKLDGDTGRLIVTAYAYVAELPYSTAYYWRVKAVSGTIGADDLAESGWASAIFITMDEPVEPTPPIVIEPTQPAPPAPIITIEQPDIIVPLPAVVETEITPSWIYVIIGVGAVLVIALLVLIVRTRRVA